VSIRRSPVAPTICSAVIALLISACSSADDAARSALDELNSLSSVAQTLRSSADASLSSAFNSASSAVQSSLDASVTRSARRTTASGNPTAVELTDDTINWFESFCGSLAGALVAAQAADQLARGDAETMVELRQDAGAAAYTQLGEQLGQAATNIGSLPPPNLPGAAAMVPGVLKAMSDLSAAYVDAAAAITGVAEVEEEPYQAALLEATAPAHAAEQELATKTQALRDSIGADAAAAVENLDSCAFLGG
jgi:hypothetical protein